MALDTLKDLNGKMAAPLNASVTMPHPTHSYVTRGKPFVNISIRRVPN